MALLLRWYRMMTQVSYPFTNPIDEQRARALLQVAFNTVIVLIIGLLYHLVAPPSAANALATDGLLRLLSRSDVFFTVIFLLSILAYEFGKRAINRGLLPRASLNGPTSFLLILFCFPIIMTGVLLEGRQKTLVNLITISTLVIIVLLHMFDLMVWVRPFQLTLLDTLLFAPLILYLQSGALSVFSDSQRKLLAHNIDLNQKLAHNINELAIANAKAMETTRLKSEFLATMSHELRTPLNAILGFTGIMLQGIRGQIDPEATRMLTRIDSNSQRLLTLINHVLDLSKIEAGRTEIVQKPFALRTLVEQWQAQVGTLAKEKGLAFEVEIDSTLPEMLIGDAERLTQIAVNLLGNAFKFTDKGEVRLKVGRNDQEWSIVVRDTGIGIPPHALGYIFDEFRQVDGSSKRIYGGSGLGLTITNNLVRMMNGRIQVESELNKGSVFSVTLPLITATTLEATQLAS
jgi:signal transduction histidine kinase